MKACFWAFWLFVILALTDCGASTSSGERSADIDQKLKNTTYDPSDIKTQIGEIQEDELLVVYPSKSTLVSELQAFVNATEIILRGIELHEEDYYLMGQGNLNDGKKIWFAISLEEDGAALNLTTRCTTHFCVVRDCCQECETDIKDLDAGACICTQKLEKEDCHEDLVSQNCRYQSTHYAGDPAIRTFLINLKM